MTITLYQASIPLLVRGLLSARLYEDMYPLSAQIQRASDTAKATASRLSGVAAPAFADNETSFDELQARINKTLLFLETVAPETVDGQEERAVTMKLRGEERTLTAQEYLTVFGLPNFLFHVTTAYGILRHQGVKLGKMDFLGL